MKTKRIITHTLGIMLLLFSISAVAQSKKSPVTNPYTEEARNLVIDGNEYASQNAFAKAESSYRQAIGLDPDSVPAKYNAGNNYYNKEKYDESIVSHLKAAQVATTKKEKHKAFHNLGNAHYQKEDFSAAVEAYKNALRNDPTDNETRYNLALAKKEEEQNGGGGGGGDDEDQEEDKNQDKEKNEKNKDGEGDKKEGDEGDEKETDDEGEEKDKEGEKKEDDNGNPDDKEKEQSGGEGEDEKKQPQQQQPQQGQLSPQQVKNLLEAMRNEEQKTQEKINARKQKGVKVKTEKDW